MRAPVAKRGVTADPTARHAAAGGRLTRATRCPPCGAAERAERAIGCDELREGRARKQRLEDDVRLVLTLPCARRASR